MCDPGIVKKKVQFKLYQQKRDILQHIFVLFHWVIHSSVHRCGAPSDIVDVQDLSFDKLICVYGYIDRADKRSQVALDD